MTPRGGVAVGMRILMELLGRARMRTTTDPYSHVLPALAEEAAERMGTALWG